VANPLSRIPPFLSELRRRKVTRVAVAYLLVAYGVFQVAVTVLPQIGGGTFVLPIALVLALGLPIALTLAWAYDITPRGIERTPDTRMPAATTASSTGAPLPSTRRVLQPGSIAALPFANLSGDPAQDYLSDGLTEELIVALSRVPGLRVAARSSCFAFKKAPQDVREIGERLGVRHVVDGGVRVAGNRLILSAQLVDVETGFVMWTESYERNFDDIFAVQRELARSIVDRVAGDAARDTAQVGRPATLNLEAFQLYLRGRYYWYRRTETDLRRAITFFEQASTLDAAYAPAWAGLADSYTLLLDYGGMSVAEGLEHARDAAERALRCDPSLGEAYTSLALVRTYEWRWSDADAAFRKSIEMRPEYSIAHQRYSLLLAWLGRIPEATREADRAEALDPLAVFVSASKGWVLYYARRFDQAKQQLEHALDMDPHFAAARVPLALTMLQLGDAAAAVSHLARAVIDSGRAASSVALHGFALIRAGRVVEGRAELVELEERTAREYVSSYYLALPRIALGDSAAALSCLETAATRERAAQLAYLKAEPLLDSLRSEPRFQALLRRVGLVS
jgi:serine/threonine-protein kinase